MTIPNIQKIIAKKHLGQNFLTDEFVLEKIIQAADIKPTDTIIEVGPGPGILTQALAPLCSKVIVIEKDPKMITILKETIKDIPNIEIHHDDILKFFIHEPKYKVVANIPYYITSPILTTFLLDQYISLKPLPELLVLMTQKEVADKIMAEPGDLSIIALKTQLFADVELVTYVSRESFSPPPKVDSAVIKLTTKAPPKGIDLSKFQKYTSAAFHQKRKMLSNSLKSILGDKLEETLKAAGIDPNDRPQNIPLKKWVSLSKK